MLTVTNSSQLQFGLRTPLRLGKGLACLAVSSLFLLSAGAHAGDVFGTSTPNATQAGDLRDRLTALEKELKEFKAQGGASGTYTAPAGKTLMVPPPPPPVPGLEDLPSQGKDKQEVLRVEKELTYDVIGTVNGHLLVRDGDATFAMTPKEFKVFEKAKRQKAVRKLSIDSLGDKFKLPLATSVPPGLPAAQDIQNSATSAIGQLNQAVANQAKGLEAIGGTLPPAPAAVSSPATSKAPAMPTAKK